MPKTKKLALMALLTAIALTIFVVENQLPAPVPIPGVKLGLANIITLVTMLLLGKKEAGAVLLVRVLMGAMFAGSPSTLLFRKNSSGSSRPSRGLPTTRGSF